MMRRAIILSVLFVLILSSMGTFRPQEGRAQGEAPTDTPTTLVGSGVNTYAHAEPKLFWHTGVPACPPALAGEEGESPTVQYPETIKRIASYGSTVRTIFSELRDCGSNEILSNIVADADYVYWLGPIGMMRISTDANVGDPEEIMNALVDAPGMLAMAEDRIYAIETNTSGNTRISYVTKSSKARVYVATPTGIAQDLQAAGSYVYWRVGSSLYRAEPGVTGGVLIQTGVTGYYAEGPRTYLCGINPIKFCTSSYVFVGKGRYAYRYDNIAGTLDPTPIYTSSDTTATIQKIVTENTLFSNRLFLWEARVGACTPFCSYTYVLIRTGRFAGVTPAALHTYGPVITAGPQNLRTNNDYLFWEEGGALKRLPNDAAALPQVNLTVTGMEVTQGIQDLSNSVLLVKERRTFVRVYVQAAGTSVSGVSAQLWSVTQDEGPLSPVNPSGSQITVQSSPDRDNINHAFLFELPWSWTNQNSQTLLVVVNPYKVPLEPNYADNDASVTVNFNNSPTLSVEFFRMNYRINNTTYSPRINEDIFKTYSWIMRAYPLGGAVGENFKPRIWDVDGNLLLGTMVNTSFPLCALVYSGPKDDIALCASYFSNGWLWAYRIETMLGLLNVGLNPYAFYYGMISDASNNFPRGQAMYQLTSVGPAGTPGQFFNLGSGWDTDGSYADWYAAHEIGHSLGRAHPNAGSDNPNTDARENCGHSRSDPNYPYGNTSSAAAPIGLASMEGFDGGDPAFGIPMAVLPSDTWNDVMSYCNNQWISDYTYEAIYNYMIAHPSLAAGESASAPNPVSGDFLAVSGAIFPDNNKAGFGLLKRMSEVNEIPALTPGDYSLRLVGAGDTTLADHAFTPEVQHEPEQLTFAQIIDFEPGTQKIEIVRAGDGQVLASHAVSSNAPVVSNVSLPGASNPVTGVQTVSWSASDADGDELSFEILYSIDNGVNFQPVAAGVLGTSADVDTSTLPGSNTGVFRVVASDGVNVGYGDSAAFDMADKPPLPFILTPGDPTSVHWGQLVNFSGMATDALDGTVAQNGLVWKNAQGATLGTGGLLSLDTLPVGENVITLQATNSAGQSASTTVTVFVDDDLNLPPATLSVGPAQIGWHVGAGATTPVMAQLSVGNAGSGSMNWESSESASWLSTDIVSGTVTAGNDATIITLTANPNGLAADQTYSTNLTITKPASGNNPEQTVVVPVALSIGDVWNAPVMYSPGVRIFLPEVEK